jgi:TDG/mug DNA glycosylase family protein
VRRGVAITNLVARPTARADELSAAEVRAGREPVERFVTEHPPRVVAVAGITAYRVAFGDKKAKAGRQPQGIGDAELWVVSNPSGLNAHATPTSLAAEYRAVAEAAGLDL